MNVKINCQQLRNKRKQRGCQNKPWNTTAGREKKQYYDNICKDTEDTNRYGKARKVF